jgi:hypothetical protein
LKKFIEFLRSFLLIPTLLARVGELTRYISTTIVELDELTRLVRRANPVRRLAFIWGNGVCADRAMGRLQELQLVCEPQWVEEGEEIQFRIMPHLPLNQIKLQVCEPFLITSVLIGNTLQAASHGAAREWQCVDSANVGNWISITVKWFKE